MCIYLELPLTAAKLVQQHNTTPKPTADRAKEGEVRSTTGGGGEGDQATSILDERILWNSINPRQRETLGEREDLSQTEQKTMT